MAGETTNGAQHLTYLDFDLSHVQSSLNEMENMLEKSVNEIRNNEKYALQVKVDTIDTTKLKGSLEQTLGEAKGAFEAQEKVATSTNEKIRNQLNLTTEQVEKYIQKLKESLAQQGLAAKVEPVQSYDTSAGQEEVTNQLKATITYYDEYGNKIKDVYQLLESSSSQQLEWTKATKNSGDTIAQQSTLLAQQEKQIKGVIEQQEAQIRLLQKQPATSDMQIVTDDAERNLRELNELLKSISGGNVLSNEQLNSLQQASQYTKVLNEDIRTRIQQEKSLTDTIQKQQSALKTINALPNSKENAAIIKEMENNLQDLYKLQESLSNQRILNPNQQADLQKYSATVKELNTSMSQANAGTQNFLKTITDKARWLSAFYLITMIEEAFRQTITVVKDTEMAVMELQRVLNETDVSDINVQDELLSIASNYGRVFDEVADSAVKFAQAGYEWNEVLKLTEATMLAVNTAELEVETATTGLIAVISQFNLEASDMEKTIDQINKTADSFPVTSEKIVAALQRAGSAAVNANLEIEQTIALVTALSKTTGRSGETIGTALNSLLVYSQRSSSLDIFASLGDDMEETVAKFRSGQADIIDVWTELSETLAVQGDAASRALSEALSTDSEYEQFASALELEAADLTDQIKEVYGTAGTHRQNYFIALLKDMENYTDYLDVASDAEGYSLKENEKYMATLTAQYNDLLANVRLLAVEFGNAGFLDFLKQLIAIGNGAVDLTRTLGGVQTALALILTVFIRIKQNDPKSFVSQLIKAFGLIPGAIGNATASMGTFTTSTITLAKQQGVAAAATSVFQKATLGLSAALKALGPAGVIGLVITGVSLYNQKINESIQKHKELIVTINDTVNARNDEIDSVNQLIDSYIELNGLENNAVNRERALDLQAEILELTGLENIELENGNLSIEQRIGLLRKLVIEQDALAKTEAQSAKDISDAQEQTALSLGLFDIAERSMYRGDWDTSFLVRGLIQDAETAEEALAALEESYAHFVDQGYADSDAAKDLKEVIENFKVLNDSAKEARNNLQRTQAAGELKVYLETNVVETTQDFEKLVEWINTTVPATDGLKEATLEYANSVYGDLVPAIKAADESFVEYVYDMEAAKERIDALNSSIDNAQSSFSTMYSVMDEYNATGHMSLDMLQQLLSLEGEYAASLQFSGNQLQFVDSATGNVINSKAELVRQLIEEQTAAQIATLAEELLEQQTREMADTNVTAANKNADLAQSFEIVVANALNGTNAIYEFSNAVSAYGEQVGLQNDYLKQFEAGSAQILENSKNLYGQIGSITGDSATWGQPTYEKMTQAMQDQNDAAIAQLEAQKQAVEDRYNAEINALKEVEKENDRIRAKEEYLDNLQNAKRDLASAQARSGVEYREAEFDAQENIDDINQDWQEQLQDWALEDQIAQLEALRDAETAAIEAQIEALRNQASSLSTQAVSEMGTMASAYTDNISEATRLTIEKGKETLQAQEDNVLLMYQNLFNTLEKVGNPTQEQIDEINKKINDDLDETTEHLMSNISGLLDFLNVGMNGISQSLYNSFKSNYISKAEQDILNLLSSVSSSTQSSVYRSPTGPYAQPTNSSNTYNSDKNMNMYVNYNSFGGTTSFGRDISDIYNGF